MRRTRILLVHLPRLLTEVIRGFLQREPDMDVLAGPADDADVAGTVQNEGVDVVILGLGADGFSSEGEGLFDANPRLCVLGVEGDGRETTLYELRPQQVRLGELSPGDLVTVIRGLWGLRGGAGPGPRPQAG